MAQAEPNLGLIEHMYTLSSVFYTKKLTHPNAAARTNFQRRKSQICHENCCDTFVVLCWGGGILRLDSKADI